MKLITLSIAAAITVSQLFGGVATAADQDGKVGITSTLKKFEGEVNGQPVVIQRNQNPRNTIRPSFAKTSRPCPPFCVQPMHLAPGVETIGELEVIDYVRRMSEGDDSILLIDSRTPDWVRKGTIPGAINIPWTRLNPARGADPISISELLTGQFGATDLEGLWDFSDAKTLVLFCDGAWCGQSPNNIKNLLRFGYPANKIKWYRGGMQAWEMLGLSTAEP